MLERTRIWASLSKGLAASLGAASLALAGCASLEPERPASPVAAAPAPASVASAAPAKAAVDPAVQAEEARALLAQAETDIQRARAGRALWSKAWEALVGARASLAANDSAAAIRQARRASELAQLGLEQRAYPAVRPAAATAQAAAGR